MSTNSGSEARPRGDEDVSPRVAVCSAHALVADSVAAALASQGFDVGRSAIGAVDGRFTVGLLIGDLLPAELGDVRAAMTRSCLPWIVLTDAPRGPQWGAVLEVGAVAVLSASSSLETVGSRLVSAGQGALSVNEEDAALVSAYQGLREEESEIALRMATLSARERQVLEQLYVGVAVRSIAESLDLAEETVRSQVKTLLRKLDVSSQIAAVALYESFHVSAYADREARGPARRDRKSGTRAARPARLESPSTTSR